ncbi:MAG: SAM-dependent methyltransferase, partial [Caulobacteraceae bacterium]
MDHLKLSLVGHSTHHFSSPVSAETLERVLALSGIERGWRAADLGCGPGAMALHLADRYGVEVEAVDRSEAMLDLARERAATRPAGRHLSFSLAESTDWLERAEPCDLLMVVGAGLLVPDAADNAAQLKALAAAVKPGGRLCGGDRQNRPSDPWHAPRRHRHAERQDRACPRAAGELSERQPAHCLHVARYDAAS